MASPSPFASVAPPTSFQFTPFSLPIPQLWAVRRKRALCSIKALREWREYEDAVREKDLARALRFLKSADLEALPVQSSIESIDSSIPSMSYSRELVRLERDWEVLDTCLNADDLRLVGSAYAFLQDRGLLPNYGKFRNVVLEGPRDVTPTVLRESTSLEAAKFAPKKWGITGSSRISLIAFLGGVSFLVSQGIDIRPNLAAILALGAIDAIYFGGICRAQILCFWPPYKRRVIAHEAGHVLIAYLLGCPIRGVILDPVVAMQMGIRGQSAGRDSVLG